MTVSNEQPPARKVIPYKSGRRTSTFRKLNIDFAGTALEEALNQQEQREQELNTDPENANLQPERAEDQSPPITTSHHQSPPSPISSSLIIEEAKPREIKQIQNPPAESQHKGSDLPPVTTSPQQSKKNVFGGIAPERDFNRRANSLERDALPSGLFPGSTKKVYDALYLRTRGAIVPVKKIKASRRDLLTWTGIRNIKTIDNHIRYLMAKGLIVRYWELGSNEGSSYEVLLPEEVQNQLPPVTTSGGYSPPDTTSQNLGIPTIQIMGSGGEGQVHVDKETYGNDKTSFKTNTERSDDDDAALALMIKTLKNATKEITGKELSLADGDRWNELAEVLMAELKIAAARTTISNVPAFLTEHLRRRLWKIDKKQARAEGRELPDEATSQVPNSIDASACPDCGGSGWWYPEGEGKGVAKCRHANLKQDA